MPGAAAKARQLTARQVLESARAKLDGGRCWTKGALARGADGGPIGTAKVGACRWCLLGAVFASAGGSDARAAAVLVEALDALKEQVVEFQLRQNGGRVPPAGVETKLPKWQDWRGREWADVDGVLAAAIDGLP